MPQMALKVVGEDPLAAQSPLFSNFVAISHVGREVQIEFLFLDLNRVAEQMINTKPVPAQGGELPTFNAKTVAKVIVPSWAFLQLKEHLRGVFEKLEIEEKSKGQNADGERAYGA